MGLFIVGKPFPGDQSFNHEDRYIDILGCNLFMLHSCGLECAVYIEVSLIVILFCLRMAMGMALDTNFQARHSAKLSCPSKTLVSRSLLEALSGEVFPTERRTTAQDGECVDVVIPDVDFVCFVYII